ncbi:MAG TPA: hypothetical protein DHV93_00975 [Holophagaceae bacterium]|nr:hypothetical protein [Holophagaceae bacterium]
MGRRLMSRLATSEMRFSRVTSLFWNMSRLARACSYSAFSERSPCPAARAISWGISTRRACLMSLSSSSSFTSTCLGMGMS